MKNQNREKVLKAHFLNLQVKFILKKEENRLG